MALLICMLARMETDLLVARVAIACDINSLANELLGMREELPNTHFRGRLFCSNGNGSGKEEGGDGSDDVRHTSNENKISHRSWERGWLELIICQSSKVRPYAVERL